MKRAGSEGPWSFQTRVNADVLHKILKVMSIDALKYLDAGGNNGTTSNSAGFVAKQFVVDILFQLASSCHMETAGTAQNIRARLPFTGYSPNRIL